MTASVPSSRTQSFASSASELMSVQALVRRKREEVGEVVGERDLFEDVPRFLPATCVERVVADLLLDLRDLLVGDLAHELGGDLLPGVGLGNVVVHLLPDLRA